MNFALWVIAGIMAAATGNCCTRAHQKCAHRAADDYPSPSLDCTCGFRVIRDLETRLS
jgi:hypothetical protein